MDTHTEPPHPRPVQTVQARTARPTGYPLPTASPLRPRRHCDISPAVFPIMVQRPKRGSNTGVIHPTQKAKCPQNAHKRKLNDYFPLFMRACGESPRLRSCNVSGHRSYGVPTFFMLWGFDVSGHRSAFSGDVSGHRSVLQASQGLPRNALLALRMRRSPGLFCFAASVARCRRVSQVTAQPPP